MDLKEKIIKILITTQEIERHDARHNNRDTANELLSLIKEHEEEVKKEAYEDGCRDGQNSM